ncbi:MAG: hypothetical protein AB1726_00030 [Planctomycetota bacterium]
MKNLDLLIRHGLLLVCLSIVSGTVLADDPPDPNSACPSTSQHSGTARGSGESTFFPDDFDKEVAEDEAKAEVLENLEIASGVVCEICWNGVQCTRSAGTGAGQITYSYTYIPGDDPQQSGWHVDASYTGDYSVSCGNCPPQPKPPGGF